jgi:predicted enzyme related to lactoylglutathione lyase
MGAPVVHFEVHGKDLGELTSFYSSLFDWEVHTVMPEYGLVHTNAGKGIDGGLGARDRPAANVVFYVQVDDPQKALDHAVDLGGKLITPVMSIPGQVTMAHFADPDGNVIGIVAAETPPAS